MSAPARPDPPRLGIVGRGRAAKSLAPALEAAGLKIVWWWSHRDPAPAGSLRPVDVVLLAVPDAAIGDAAATLAARPSASSEIWLHLSGSVPGARARASAEAPAHAGCLHPLVALSGRPDAALVGATAGVDGEDVAVGVAVGLAERLGLRPLRLSPATKALYHAAAVTVAGHAVALFSQAEALLGRCGLGPDDARPALAALMRGALAPLDDAAPSEVITGPIARGDVGTVQAHLDALEGLGEPAFAATYRVLARAALALSAEHLAPDAAARLAAALRG